MSSAVNCEAPIAGARNPEPVVCTSHPDLSITDKESTSTWQRWWLLPAISSLCFLAGCATPPPPPAQTVEPQGPEILTEPVPGLVKYRVDKGDKLVLSLRDGSGEWLTVKSVDGDVIRGREDFSVAIADIQKLEILQQPPPSSIAEATVGILGMSVLIPLSIALFPVALPAVLIIDWDKPKHWNDGLLCQVTAHPEFYGYTAEGLVAAGEERPDLQDVRNELARRKLSCDTLTLDAAEYSCAKDNDSGPAFESCSATKIASANAGMVSFYHWSGDALCRVHRDPGTVEYLASAPEEEQKIILQRVSAALSSAKVNCPEVEPAGAEQATLQESGDTGSSEGPETIAEEP